MSAGILTTIRENRAILLLLPAVLLLLILFVYPLIEVLRTSLFDPDFTTRHFERFFDKPVYFKVFYGTTKVSLIVTLVCFILGYPAAYYLAHVRPKVRGYLIFLILLPFWTSLLIRTYAWMAVLGREGVINSFLHKLGFISEPLKMLYTTEAVYVAMAQILLPIMILTCYAVMVEIDRDLVKAARVLGAGPFRGLPPRVLSLERERRRHRLDHRLHPLDGLLRHPGAGGQPEGLDGRKPDRVPDQ